MPEGNVLKLIDIFNSGIYQLLTAWFYDYKLFFQVGWIIYLFNFMCDTLGLKNPTLPSLSMVHQVPSCWYSPGSGEGLDSIDTDYGPTTIKAKRESSSESKLSSSTRAA